MKGMITIALTTVVALCGFTWDAEACSCGAHMRHSLVPPDGSEDVPTKTNILFLVSGHSGTKREKEYKAQYALYREEGKRDVQVPITVELVGNMGRIIPTGRLRENAWHRLEVGRKELTRFQTGKDEILPSPPKPPEIAGMTQAPSKGNTPSCGGRSHQVKVDIRDMGMQNDLTTLFFWELTYSQGGQWIPYQAAPVKLYDRRRREYKVNNRITVGHGQCGCGPVFTGGNHSVKISLVRVDGKRWESNHQNLFVSR